MISISHELPTWKVIPCYTIATNRWLCKRKLSADGFQYNTDLSAHNCCTECMRAYNNCYKQKRNIKMIKSERSCHSDIHWKKKYFQHMLNIINSYIDGKLMAITFSEHDLSRKYEKRICTVFSEVTEYLDEDIAITPSSVYSYFVLETVPGHITECGPNQHECIDGSCVIQNQHCTRNNHCDSELCRCKVIGAMVSDLEYCTKRCATPICECSLLSFQCTIGGCLPYLFVCDGNANCRDSSDEFCLVINDYKISIPKMENANIPAKIGTNGLCLGFRCSDGLCIHLDLVNDLIPDCSSAGDERHSIDIKYKDAIFTCEHEQDIPCAPNHSKCFKFYHLCVYDINAFGQAAYCRDAAHIRDCDNVECTNTFKCPRSYCIPFRKVCDGVRDCIAGEEEMQCLPHICKGLLRCIDSSICIPPFEVCDGTPHCPYGDDEILCDINFCPRGCQCIEYSTICRDKIVTNIPIMGTDHIKYLSIGYDMMYVPDFTNLMSQSRLIILNMSYSVIEDVCPSFKLVCQFYHKLLILLLNHNKITRVTSVCFSRLSSLFILNLENNPLSLISRGTFQGLPLGLLNVQDTRIYEISAEWLVDLKHIRILNIRNLYIKSIHEDAIDILNNINFINTVDARVCCFMSRSKACQQITIRLVSCLRIISKVTITQTLMVIGGWSIVFCLLSIALNAILHASRKPVLCFLISMHIVGNLLSSTYFILIAITDWRYGSQYVLNATAWVDSILCQILTIVLFTGTTISNFSSLLLNQYIFDTVSSMVPLRKTYSIGITVTVLVVMISSMVVFSILQIHRRRLIRSDVFHGLCILLAPGFNENVYTLIPVILLTALLVACFVHSMIISVFIINKASSSGKSVSKISSLPKMRVSSMIQLIKHNLQYASARAITTLPIPCAAALYLIDENLQTDVGLIMFAISVFMGCYCESVFYIWSPFLKSMGFPKWCEIFNGY